VPAFEYALEDTRITAVLDWVGEVPHAQRLLPGTTRVDWERHQDLLVGGRLWDPVTDRRVVSIVSWLVRIGGLTMVIDTGAGNGKNRPGSPLFHHLSTGYLDNLANAGVPRRRAVVPAPGPGLGGGVRSTGAARAPAERPSDARFPVG